MTDEPAAAQTGPLLDELLSATDKFLAGQRTTLRLVDFIAEREAEIDNRRSRVLEIAKREYPGVDPEAVWKTMQSFDSYFDLENPSRSESEGEDRAQRELKDKITSLPPELRTADFLASVARAQAQAPSTPLLLSSLLVTLVGDFEMLVGSLARSLYGQFPGALSASQRSFTWDDISSHESLENLREHVIDRAVDDLLRESCVGWMKHFSSKHKIRIPETANSTDFVEVFQRRHLIVHNGGEVSSLYLANLPELDPVPAVGERLTVNETYLRGAADILCVAALALVGNVARGVLRGADSDRFEEALANQPYRLLQDGRFWAAHRMTLEHGPESFVSEYRKVVTKVNRWLSLKRLGRIEECRDDIEAWDTAPLANVFKLAKLALLDDLEAGHAFVKKYRGTTDLPLSFWITWPLLSELRAYEREVDGVPDVAGAM